MILLESRRVRLGIIFAAVLLPVIGVLFLAPVAQPQSYHQFADQRDFLGIPNLLNVMSNLPFALVGLAGLYRCYQVREYANFRVFLLIFSGILLTAFGSGYYHWSPDNSSLVWDRLPMTVAFMGFFTFLLAECVASACVRLLWWLVFLGIASVCYWAWTESKDIGDLRFYGLVQFVPLAITPLVLYLFPCAVGELKYYLGLLGCYGLAKLFEHLDLQLWQLLGVVSGHTLKHLVAAAGTCFILLLLNAGVERQRTR